MTDHDRPKRIVLTRENIHAGKSERGGWTRAQLALLGVAWPPMKGWLSALIGTELAKADYLAFLTSRNRRELKQRHKKPLDHAELFSDDPALTERIEAD